MPGPHAFGSGWEPTNGQWNIIMAETTSGLETDAVFRGEKKKKPHNFKNLTLLIPGPGRGRKERFTLFWSKRGNMKNAVQSG